MAGTEVPRATFYAIGSFEVASIKGPPRASEHLERCVPRYARTCTLPINTILPLGYDPDPATGSPSGPCPRRGPGIPGRSSIEVAPVAERHATRKAAA